MNNDPELNGKYLGTITKDFVNVSDTLKEASYQIRKRNMGQYPIFPVAKTEMAIGTLLIGQYEAGENTWFYHASLLEEFVQRGLIANDKKDDFIAAYKDPDEYCCLFVVDLDFTNFVFIPFPED